MSECLSICKLNIVLLFKDKLSFVWSLALPSVMLFINISHISSAESLIYWWIYIIFTSLIYGVGLHALSEKDSGVLSIIFSIKWIPIQYFLGCLLTQVIYSTVCLSMFNLIPAIIFGYNYFYLMLLSGIALIVTLPVAFVGYNLTYLKNAYATTVTSICNVLIFFMFIVSSMDHPLNQYNPLIILSQTTSQFIHLNVPVPYILCALLLIFLSIPSIVKFQPLSTESR